MHPVRPIIRLEEGNILDGDYFGENYNTTRNSTRRLIEFSTMNLYTKGNELKFQPQFNSSRVAWTVLLSYSASGMNGNVETTIEFVGNLSLESRLQHVENESRGQVPFAQITNVRDGMAAWVHGLHDPLGWIRFDRQRVKNSWRQRNWIHRQSSSSSFLSMSFIFGFVSKGNG